MYFFNSLSDEQRLRSLRVSMRPSTGTQVNFYDCAGKLYGKVVAVKDQKRKSEIGTVIMTGAIKTGDNQWKGDLLNTDDGKIYSGVVTLQGPSALNLKRFESEALWI